MSEKFNLAARKQSFFYAFKGLKTLFLEQHNARIHLLAVAVVIVLATVLQLDSTDWAILILTMALVLMAEAMNTAVEYLADACMPEHHPLIAKAKDVAAAGVLITAIAAIGVALAIVCC